MKTQIFSTHKELLQEYENVRNDILVRHGYKKGDKVRLNKAMALYQRYGKEWVKVTYVKSDMISRVKMFESLETLNGEFYIESLI